VNGLELGRAERIFSDLITALNESSRYHGYRDPRATRFLEYSVWRYVDLQDPDGIRGRNSSATLRKTHVPVIEDWRIGGGRGGAGLRCVGARA